MPLRERIYRRQLLPDGQDKIMLSFTTSRNYHNFEMKMELSESGSNWNIVRQFTTDCDRRYSLRFSELDESVQFDISGWSDKYV